LSLPLADLIQSHFKQIINDGNGEQDLALLVSHLRSSLSK
jgi:hypothetical protein